MQPTQSHNPPRYPAPYTPPAVTETRRWRINCPTCHLTLHFSKRDRLQRFLDDHPNDCRQLGNDGGDHVPPFTPHKDPTTGYWWLRDARGGFLATEAFTSRALAAARAADYHDPRKDAVAVRRPPLRQRIGLPLLQVVLLAGGPPSVPPDYYDPPPPAPPAADHPVERWRPLVTAWFRLEADTALAYLACESSGDPNAVGDNGASRGLFQIAWDNIAGRWEYPAGIRAAAGIPTDLTRLEAIAWLHDPARNVAAAWWTWWLRGRRWDGSGGWGCHDRLPPQGRLTSL